MSDLSGKAAPGELELINKYTRTPLNENDVYVFSVVLCDNDIDRDCERFSDSSLEKLSELYVGVTGITDHEAKSSNQSARVFSCKTETLNDRQCSDGRTYKRLFARAYIPRNDRSRPLIEELESGIKKEVSVGCSVKRRICSICGNDIAVCDHIRGRKYAGKLDVGAAVGRGLLTVSMDLGLKEPYNGSVEIQTGEIGDDLAYYFSVSEQTPSAVGLGVMVDTDSSVRHAGGFIIQLMPDADEETISEIEKRVSGAEPVTSMMEEGMTPEDILRYFLGGLDLVITEKQPVRYYCGCSKEKVARALATISSEDLREIINEGEEIEVKCYFCNSAYHYSIAELEEIMASRK